MKLFFESAKICEICGLKRIFDLVMAFGVLILLSVPMLIIAVLVKVKSKGPTLYWSDRVGIRRQRSVVRGQWSERNSGWLPR